MLKVHLEKLEKIFFKFLPCKVSLLCIYDSVKFLDHEEFINSQTFYLKYSKKSKKSSKIDILAS